MAEERTPTKEEIAANIKKTEAETHKAAVEADAVETKAKAEADKLKAEARKTVAEAKQVELKLVEAQHEADRAEHKRKKELSADEHHFVYHFNGAFDGASVDKCLDQLNVWNRNEEAKGGKIEIVFRSPGGAVIPGMALFDEITAMRCAGWYFTTTCRGYAASMGGILLQAGDVRKCGPESYILIHEIASSAVGKIGELEDEVEFIRMIQDRVLDIFVDRSGGKVTKAKLRSMYRRKDFWLSSEKALRLGIVDEIG